MYCIFCPADDQTALWAYRGLKLRGLTPLEIFTPEALVYNRRLEHRLQAGETILRINLSDGRVIDGRLVRGVLNRITTLPIEHFRAAEPDDQAYAIMEQQAIYLSWMYGLQGVMINRPGPRGLCGDIRSPSEWAWLAAQAGLPALPFHQSDEEISKPSHVFVTSQVVLLDGKIYGESIQRLNDNLRSSIKRLAELSGLRLLGVDFAITPEGDPFFVSATALPELRLGGDALLDALMAVFI